jgi:hypothetical protein
LNRLCIHRLDEMDLGVGKWFSLGVFIVLPQFDITFPSTVCRRSS